MLEVEVGCKTNKDKVLVPIKVYSKSEDSNSNDTWHVKGVTQRWATLREQG